jgi:hypothetical protein
MTFKYTCSFEVQVFENGQGTFKNYEKQFTLQNSAVGAADLLMLSSSLSPWSHFCENCSGAKEKYNGQKFASPVEVRFEIMPASFGTVYANLTYITPGGYSFISKVALLSAPLPDEVDHAFPVVKSKRQLLKSHLYCRSEANET